MKRRVALSTLVGSMLLLPHATAGVTGADALFQALGESPSGAQNGQAQMNPAEYRLNDSFKMQLFASWQTQTGLSYELNSWVVRILKDEHESAAHLWTALRDKIPASFENEAKAANLYLLWKLGLTQTFFDSWMETQGTEFSDSRIALALDQAMTPGFSEWLWKNAPSVSPEQKQKIQKLQASRGLIYSSLRAYVSLREGKSALSALKPLAVSHPLRPLLARTVALGLARSGDLGGAAKVLKTELEPSVEAGKDPLQLADHYLQVARLLYQAGALDAAEQFYEKIPDQAPQFLDAREELAWVWLRQGNSTKLRGELETLSSKLFSDRFAPELHLVRAVSNLKFCYYNKVEESFDSFLKSNRIWATRIEKELKASDPKAPRQVDPFTQLAARALKNRSAEEKRLGELAKRSIGATLPAVGPQLHWREAALNLRSHVESAKKSLASEHRRIWKNRKLQLSEAIRKMQFVKVELLSQIRLLSKNTHRGVSADSIRSSQAAARELASRKNLIRKSKSDEIQTFPFDGVIWPDELFQLRSAAQSRCLEAIQ